MEIIQDIKRGKLISAIAVGPFDKGKAALEAEGYELISTQQDVRLRRQCGPKSVVSKRGNWTREGFIYDRQRGIYITKRSPIMESAEDATNAHRNKSRFYINQAQVESALEDAVKITRTEFPTDRLADFEEMSYLMGEEARKYGEFARKNGIDKIKILLAPLEDKSFATQLWLNGIRDERSNLDGYCISLDRDTDSIYGVRPASANQRTSAYTPA